MGIVVDIGLGRYDYDVRRHEIALTTIVREGFTTLVRDFVDEDILEVRATEGGARAEWLAPDRKKTILDELAALESRSVDFGYWHLEKLHVDFIQTLAFVRDAASAEDAVVLPGNIRAPVIDLTRSLDFNWRGRKDPNARIAAQLHRFARKHRMIIHSE